MKGLNETIVQNYESQPMVIIYDEDQLLELITFLKESNIKHIVWEDLGTLEEIRNWDYGVLLLTKLYCRGVDTRF